jgi:hypothetical protein
MDRIDASEHVEFWGRGNALAAISSLAEVRLDEAVEGIDRFHDDLRHLKERWDNRLVLEHRPFWEYYISGRGEILLYGKWSVGSYEAKWAVRIPAYRAILDDICANPGVYVSDTRHGHDRDEIVVLVVVAQACGGPKVQVCIPARLYLFQDKVCKVGEGLLYKRVVGGSFEVFPFFRKGEIGFPARPNDREGGIDPVFHGFPKIIDGVAYDSAEVLRNWLFGSIDEVKTVWFQQEWIGSRWTADNFIQINGHNGRLSDKHINVAVGPFDL